VTSGRCHDSGQALVETAIVMPLFVFVLLGTLQLGLMHQAQALTTYAAYRAARAGALNHAQHSVMRRAAAAPLMPMMSIPGGGGGEKVFTIQSAAEYALKVQAIRALDFAPIPPVEVKICGPTLAQIGTRNGLNANAPNLNGVVQFDAPLNIDQANWRASDRTKLRVEVTFQYRMPIPFANMMIYQIARGQEDAELLLVTRTGEDRDWGRFRRREQRFVADAMAAAGMGYTLPIRATYTMRMMSDLYPRRSGYTLPQNNTCHIPFARGAAE